MPHSKKKIYIKHRIPFFYICTVTFFSYIIIYHIWIQTIFDTIVKVVYLFSLLLINKGSTQLSYIYTVTYRRVYNNAREYDKCMWTGRVTTSKNKILCFSFHQLLSETKLSKLRKSLILICYSLLCGPRWLCLIQY
jgi:hypothetical protein